MCMVWYGMVIYVYYTDEGGFITEGETPRGVVTQGGGGEKVEMGYGYGMTMIGD